MTLNYNSISSISRMVESENLDRNIIFGLTSRLSELNYYVLEPIRYMTPALKFAMNQYQSDHDLCIGPLTYETLNHLNLDLDESYIHYEEEAIDSFNFFRNDTSRHILNYLSSEDLVIEDSTLLKNPSFEDIPRRGGQEYNSKISEWFDCGLIHFKGESPPDIHPTKNPAWNVQNKPAYGKTYLGMVVRDNDSWEALAQKLEKPLVKDNRYAMSVYLAQSSSYLSHSQMTKQKANYNNPTTLRIWGANKYCGRTELLLVSDPIDHIEWKEYTFEFQPKESYSYIVIEAYYNMPVSVPYNGHILLDAFSPIYRISKSETLDQSK